MSVPKVAAINDLSGLGKCSLTAAIPILAAAGVQACPMPTAVLSNQTGFPSYAAVSLAEHLDAFAHQWELRGIQLDGIFSGFLMDAAGLFDVESIVMQSELAQKPELPFSSGFTAPELGGAVMLPRYHKVGWASDVYALASTLFSR